MNRVLVIEDDGATRLHLETVLVRGGFEVVAVGDVNAAMSVLEGPRPPLLVIMGWEMPGTGGFELLRWLRGSERRAGTWVLMLTGRSHLEDEIAALDAGADDYLVKPVDAGRLRAHVRAGVRRIAGLAAGGGPRGRAAA